MASGAVRVYELARTLQVSSTAVLGALAELLESPPTNPSATVPPELVGPVSERIRSTEGSSEVSVRTAADLDADTYTRGKQLIEGAFAVAKLAGKPEWHHMRDAVLKNRILDLTGHGFRESEYGVRSFSSWLALFSDVVSVDHSQMPAMVELLDESRRSVDAERGMSPVTVDQALPARWRVRADLWQVMLDYAGEGRWVWNGLEPIPLEEAASTNYPVLPTLSTSEVRQLRAAFAEEIEALDAERIALESWADKLLPSAALPIRIRAQWYAHLKRHVHETLQAWFRANGLPEPDDLIESLRVPPSVKHRRADGPIDALRGVVIDCVRVMTLDELNELRLPPAALLRARERG